MTSIALVFMFIGMPICVLFVLMVEFDNHRKRKHIERDIRRDNWKRDMPKEYRDTEWRYIPYEVRREYDQTILGEVAFHAKKKSQGM